LWFKTAVAIAMNLDQQSAEVAALERLLALSCSTINSVIRKQLKTAEEPIYQCQHPPSKLGWFHGQLDDRPDSQCFSFINEGVEEAI